ncbi:MAG: glycosyltransferase family 2 protein [Candidatus Limnocylindrales bacterium]
MTASKHPMLPETELERVRMNRMLIDAAAAPRTSRNAGRGLPATVRSAGPLPRAVLHGVSGVLLARSIWGDGSGGPVTDPVLTADLEVRCPEPVEPHSLRHQRLDAVVALRPFTSAIVRVHNAAATVEQVVRTLLASAYVDEVLCVDDRSSDGSLSLLRGFGREIVLVEHGLAECHGRGRDFAEGAWKANGTIVLFVDAGLTTLSDGHIRALVAPLEDDRVRAVLGCPAPQSVLSSVTARLTGSRFATERAYRRGDLLRHLLPMARAGSGVDVYLDGAFRRDEVLVVQLAGLHRAGMRGAGASLRAAGASMGAAVEIARAIFRRTVGRVRMPAGPQGS